MKKLLFVIISMLVLLSGCSTHKAASSKVTPAKQELIVKTYTVKSIDTNGYYTTGKNEGLYIEKKDINFDLNKGDKVKVSFTKEQFKTGEGMHKIELITKEYKVTSIDLNGYVATTSNNESVYLDKNDINNTLHVGDQIKVSFTQAQYESMEGYKKVELVK